MTARNILAFEDIESQSSDGSEVYTGAYGIVHVPSELPTKVAVVHPRGETQVRTYSFVILVLAPHHEHEGL